MEHSYSVNHEGHYYNYVTYVSIEETSRKQTIELYRIKRFLGIKFEQYIPDAKTIKPHEDVDATIYDMIKEYEMPRYQREKAEQADPQLHIDFEAEIAKRNPKRKEQPKVIAAQAEPPKEQKSSDMELTKVTDWQGGTYWVNQKGNRVHPNSIKNLKQYQNK